MNPAHWTLLGGPGGFGGWLSSYLWQVALHSSILGVIFYAWAHRVGLPSGPTKRRLLATLLLLPMLTAAVPGRAGLEFTERLAWFNSARVLAIPLPLGFRVQHIALVIAAMMTMLTIWQEVVPALRRPKIVSGEIPAWLAELVTSQPGWQTCAIALSPLASVLVATSGRPGRPRLIVSNGALRTLSPAELAAIVIHEHAHWREGRWMESHLLFVARLLQFYHPAALWAFREYCVEMEIECDAAAATASGRITLVHVLLRTYKETEARDVAARAALQKRVEVLLAAREAEPALPPATVWIATSAMFLVLPWIV